MIPISYYLPPQTLDNPALEKEFGDWSSKKIYNKTGISVRHIATRQELVSDMAAAAAEKLLCEHEIERSEIDFVILVTQSPDYCLPSTACIVANKLNLGKRVGAFDINLGCSGFIYGLSVAKGLCVSGTAHNILLICAETYSKYIHPLDRSTRTIFGDGAAACLITMDICGQIGQFVLGTDGSHYEKLIIPASGANRMKLEQEGTADLKTESTNARTPENLFMDGVGIFNFTLDVVPNVIGEALEVNGLTDADIDLYVPHQANKHMLTTLRDVMGISPEKFYIDLEETGNTVSATIPIALRQAQEKGILKPGMRLILVGFGVGLSWGAVSLLWR